jgi:hypothetical protein
MELIVNSLFHLIFILGYLFASAIGCSDGGSPIKILYLEQNEKRLLFYGSDHSNDPDDSMFEDIEKRFLEFQPEIALVEGKYYQETYSTRDQAIISGGEQSFVVYLAGLNEIPVGTMEPSDEDTIDFLRERYNPKSILAMYILRQVIQLQREAGTRSFDFQYEIEECLVKSLSEAELNVIDPNGEFTEELMSLLDPYLEDGQNISNWDTWDAQGLVYDGGSPELHQIWLDTVDFRDIFGVAQIERTLSTHDRVFVIMGGRHVTNQEERLRKLFSSFES